jgi:formylglycine-generating enzyme required for sulfatase activity
LPQSIEEGMKRVAVPLLLLIPLAAFAGEGIYRTLPGGTFRSSLQFEDVKTAQRVAPFRMMQRPVTNGEYLAFVKANPDWQRGRVPGVFAESRYLSHWQGPLTLGPGAAANQPVTWVSWFAASAYCEAQAASLPTWQQWEYVAAADESRRDARSDPAWRERILAWYSRPSSQALPRAGLQPANAYGVQDMHGLVWEWTEDFSSLLVSGDNRNQGDADKSRFCGAGALSTNDRDNYAVLMRVAMLSSLEGKDATANMGFRCVRSQP